MGIIPAYAGNTKDYREHAPHVWDHPRVCGEHHMTSIMVHLNWGSSPRMRGTHAKNVADAAKTGIIPAYAGNTYYVTLPRLIVWDHPRVCGEHGELVHVGQPVAGSSPRMRGTPVCAASSETTPGIIPAYAGNTKDCRVGIGFLRDHPRVCGEH